MKHQESKNWIARLGKQTIEQIQEITAFLSFVGEITAVFLYTLKTRQKIRWKPFFGIIETMGYQALPIIALLSFMIGVVLTYQMGLQLKTYGANIFIVDLLGVAVLREFGPLLTAIMIAGRTGAAFAAHLGTMKLNEEIDALKTMGITPAEFLIIPRLMGLLVALPLLTIWSDAFAIFGGMVMSKHILGLSWIEFLDRFQMQISVNSLLMGLGKTPIFALLIGTIGCFQGMRVKGGADSVGKQTIKSVVQGIFFILLADAVFSVLFSKFGL